jgi:hypothetical protein
MEAYPSADWMPYSPMPVLGEAVTAMWRRSVVSKVEEEVWRVQQMAGQKQSDQLAVRGV